MNKKIFRFSILVFATWYLLFAVYYLYAGTGSTGWIIFRKAQSPRPKPITTVYAIRGDLSGVLYNPSVLATLQQKEIFTMVESGLTEDKIAGLIYGHPFGRQAISIGALTYDAGKMILYWIEDGQEKEREVTAQSDLLGFVSFGKAIKEKVQVGLTVKFATSKIADTKSATAYAGDVGLSYLVSSKLTLSVVAQNIGTTTKFLDKAEKLPASIWAGIGLWGRIGSGNNPYYYAVGADVPYILDENRVTPSIGIEFGKLPVSIFAGYRFKVEEGIFNIGLAFMMKNFDISYAYIPATWLSPTHRVSFSVRF